MNLYNYNVDIYCSIMKYLSHTICTLLYTTTIGELLLLQVTLFYILIYIYIYIYTHTYIYIFIYLFIYLFIYETVTLF